MQQTFFTQVAITAVKRIRHTFTMFFSPFTSTGHITVIVKSDYDRYWQSMRHIQAGKYADTYVQVTGSLLNRVEVGEERQVSKLNFFKPYSCTDEAFRVTNITVVSTVILPDVLNL